LKGAHNNNYFNVPLEVFYTSLRDAVAQGYSVAVDVDISEPSYELTKDVGIIPDFDIPAAAISQEARELRFNNGTTTDDHLAQIVGYKKFGAEEWFLAKDSLPTSWEEPRQGYVFFHASYIKLKVLAFLVHRDGVPAMKQMLLEQSGEAGASRLPSSHPPQRRRACRRQQTSSAGPCCFGS